jgi:hypothetical protein
VRGSIRTKVKGKRYEIRVALGLDPKTGRYRQKSLTVRGTRAEAERALRRLLAGVEAGAPEDKAQGSVTFGELLDEWLAFKVAADRSPTPSPATGRRSSSTSGRRWERRGWTASRRRTSTTSTGSSRLA